MRYISYIILFIIVLIFLLPLNLKNTSNDIVNNIIRPFYHANALHLIANFISFYGLSPIEELMGHLQFLIAIFFLWITSSMLLLFYHKLIPSRKITTVGFSGVIFGLTVIYIRLVNVDPNMSYIKLLLSILPQIVIPNVSIEGHICGILAGILYVTLFSLSYHNN